MGIAGGILSGLAQGAERGMRLRRQMDQEDQDRKDRDEDRRLAKELREIQLKRLRDDETDRVALRNAASPATVSTPQDVANDDEGNPMPAAPRFEVAIPGQTGQRVNSQPEAAAIAAQHNDPVALSNRVATTLAGQGKVKESMEFSSKAMEHADKQWQRKLQQAIQTGHEGLAKLVTESESGVFQGKRVKPVTSPDGKTVNYVMVGEDGTETPTKLQFPNDEKGVITAAYMLDRSVPPATRYRNMVDDDRKRSDAERKDRELDEVKIPLAEARGQAAQAQGAAAEARAEAALTRASRTGGDKVDAEDRKRWTSLHSEAGRQLTDARKRLAQLQGDVLFMSRAKKPGTAEASQLQGLQDDMENYKQDRELYGGLLGGKVAEKAREDRGAAPAAPAKAPAAGKAAAAPSAAKGKAKVAAPTSKAEYAALPPGTKYQHPEDPPGTYRTKK